MRVPPVRPPGTRRGCRGLASVVRSATGGVGSLPSPPLPAPVRHVGGGVTCRRKSLVSSERSPLPGDSSAPAGAPERACARESAWRVCLSGRPAGPHGRAAGPCPLSAPSAPAPAPAAEFHEFHAAAPGRPALPQASLRCVRPLPFVSGRFPSCHSPRSLGELTFLNLRVKRFAESLDWPPQLMSMSN